MRNLIILGVVLLLLFMGCNSYNGMVGVDQEVKAKWSQVENQYKRRADLIPNLVNTVKGAANFEQQTLVQLTEARAKATQMTVNPNDLTPENIAKFQQLQGQVGSALGRLLSVTENYPTLKANENFLKLQDELAGTAGRISVAIKDYNEVVKDYNVRTLRFPASIFAKLFGFSEKGFFQAAPEDSKNPEVKF
jgi:LemA protein